MIIMGIRRWLLKKILIYFRKCIAFANTNEYNIINQNLIKGLLLWLPNQQIFLSD